ncbi:MAG TPA: glycerol-3-phosphate 1-O-acyltransferase PlsY [Verrucomicrobiae bacterium]|nr:glycerol-3-phosphate 1-O-acyltransferase PlsY [Verrucomicrobiae bacterium]
MFELLAKIALAYLLGTAMGGFIVGRLRGGVDLRTQGSGNVGATNALRTQGKGFALAVLLIDVGKGVLAVTLVPALTWPLPGAMEAGTSALPFACGVAAALGHVYPAWFGFHGGKGAATLAGIYAVLLTAGLPWMMAAFALVLVLTGYVGLSTVTAALTALLYVTCFDPHGVFTPAGLFTATMAALMVYTHRENLVRLWQGHESRFEKAMVLRRWLGP